MYPRLEREGELDPIDNRWVPVKLVGSVRRAVIASVFEGVTLEATFGDPFLMMTSTRVMKPSSGDFDGNFLRARNFKHSWN